MLLFGGSFDPIHNGHLEIAKNAIKHTQYDEVWFLVAALNPFKDKSTSFQHRVKMIELMIRPFKKLKVCTIENDMPTPSYSIDTVKRLMKIYPKVEFGFLIGSDQIPKLNEWKDFDKLNQLVAFSVYEREGHQESHNYPVIPGSHITVSSTEIRKGQSNLTSKHVLRYMMYEGLYLEEIVRNNMSEFRYHHTLEVTKLALELGSIHKVDLKKMRLIAMMHDLCKEWEATRLKEIVSMIDERLLEYPSAFYHAFAASYWLNHYYCIYDKQILSAIHNHVHGGSYSKYGMILYIADKCERTRPYDTETLIDLSKQNLIEGFHAVKLSSEKYIKEHI